jgi:hypothetical protein
VKNIIKIQAEEGDLMIVENFLLVRNVRVSTLSFARSIDIT